jgi:hypothetical protein
VVVLDNLKEGVAVPDIFDPTVNPLFRDVSVPTFPQFLLKYDRLVNPAE